MPLYQPDRFELSEPKTAYTGYVGEETSLTIDYVNKGKSAINNVEATISGDIDTPTAISASARSTAARTAPLLSP